MPANKDRLYIALYARSGAAKMPGLEDTYHWALIIGPKKEDKNDYSGTKYHVKSAIGQSKWEFEEKQIQLGAVDMILVRVRIAKIVDLERTKRILRNKVPLKQDDAAFNCVAWVKHALELLEKDKKALGTSCLDWERVSHTAMMYCQRKKEKHRFDGVESYDTTVVPTFDLLEGCETTP